MAMSETFSESLFERVLVEPVREGAEELYVLSGDASPAMVLRHFEEIRKINPLVQIELQVGMTGENGLSSEALGGYRNVAKQLVGGRFKCKFNVGRPTNVNLYVWCTEDGPFRAFVGSAGYTQSAFGLNGQGSQRMELCVEVDATNAFDVIVSCSGSSVDLGDPLLEQLIPIIDLTDPEDYETPGELSSPAELFRFPSVVLPIVQVAKNPGQVHNEGAGLNWGHRGNRNRNEAYIPIPASIRESGFFPKKGVRFQIVTDDGEHFVGTVAQQGSKAIETPEDNALIGCYFRKKLGLASSSLITTADLERFGSTGVLFDRVGEDVFQMRFHPGIFYPI